MKSSQLHTLNLVDIEQAYRSVVQLMGADDVFAIAFLVAAAALYTWLVREQKDPFAYKMYERPQEHMAKTKFQPVRDIAEKLDQVDTNVVIFWGSQSGTAERMAGRLSKEIRQRFGEKALAVDISDYDPSSIVKLKDSKLAIFVVSTFGEGDPSDNVHDLWSWLDAVEDKPARNLKFVALGLGNSNYKYYNAVVDVIVAKLNKLGAECLLPVGKADDAQGQTEEHYLDFKAAVFQLLKRNMKFEEQESVYEPSLQIVEDMSLEPIDLHQGEPWMPDRGRKASRLMSPIYSLPVTATRELFDEGRDRNCIHMEFGLQKYPGLKYKTGDHLGIWPTVPQPEIDCLLRCLGLISIRERPFLLKSLDHETELKVPTPTNLQALLGNHLDTCSAVSRETIASLVQFAPTQAAKDLLIRLSDDKAAYGRLSNTMYINLGRLLEHAAPGEGAWKALPLSFVVDALPAMQPRYYSISSSSVVHARRITITAVVSDRRLNGGAVVPGLCTNLLLGVQRNFLGRSPNVTETRIHAHVRRSTFKLPVRPSQPIIMVAAGTGVAPFRAFLQERARLLKMGHEIGRMVLFFGCRHEAHDYIYKDELQGYSSMPGLGLSIITAFSRPSAGQRVYVQDRVRQCAGEVCDLVTNEANLYICGSAAMARDVSKVLGDELQIRQDWNDEQLRAFVDKQKRTRRWQQDVWG